MPQPGLILIVDDEPKNRRILQSLVAPLGYATETATDGLEALAAAERLRPDLILLDVMMPELDGFQVCRQLRANPATAEVTILLVTALDDRDARLRGIEAGADDYLTKPVDGLELRARVGSVMRLNRYRRLLVERQRFAWIVEQAQEGYLLLSDPPADMVIDANPAARRFLGLAPEAPLADLSFTALTEARYRREPEANWASGASPRYLICPDSAQAPALWLEVTELQLPAAGAGRVVRLRDATQQFDLQRGAWSFAAMTSHKFRTPLALLASSLEALESEPDTLSAGEIQQLAHIARNGLERLRSQADSVLAFATATGMAREAAPFPAGRLAEVVTELAQDLGLAEATTSVDPAWLTQSLWPGPQGLELCLREILVNARKFHPRGQPRITVELAGAAGRAYLRVTDDGVRLTEDQLARIWTPYYQAERMMTGQLPGLGIGLTMVAALVWSSGGQCRAYNRAAGPGVVIELDLAPAG